jgi:hypothetical protein
MGVWDSNHTADASRSTIHSHLVSRFQLLKVWSTNYILLIPKG